MKKIKIALIGASQIARKVLPMINDIETLIVSGVASKHTERAKSFAKDLAVSHVYTNYSECFADPQINAVYISVLSSDHAMIIEQALLSGKHVLCEKPLVLNTADARRLFQIAEEKHLILLEGLMYRFHPQIIKMHEIIESGILGKLCSINICFSFDLYDFSGTSRPTRATKQAGGGALNDLGCYAIDFINCIIPIEQSLLAITTYQRHDAEIDLETRATLRYSDELAVDIQCALDRPTANVWEISGAKGSIVALRYDPQGSKSTHIYIIDENSVGTLIKCEQGNQFRNEFSHFADAILGKISPHISAAHSIRNAELAEKIREAF